MAELAEAFRAGFNWWVAWDEIKKIKGFGGRPPFGGRPNAK